MYLSPECVEYLHRAANALDCAVQLGAGPEVAKVEEWLDLLAYHGTDSPAPIPHVDRTAAHPEGG